MTPRTVFVSKAPGLMKRLIERYEVVDFQAAGAAGNLGHESNGFTQLHELGQPAGRGGYGWAQWTGPRRKTFFDWCHTHNLDWTSDEGNISYLLHELDGDSKIIAALLKTKNLEEATISFERNFERAGVVNMASRNKWAQIALDAYRGGLPHAA